MKTDRTVVITGAAGGMGAVFVNRFLANGDTVLATDTSQEALEKLSGSTKTDRLHTAAADITDEEDGQPRPRTSVEGPPDGRDAGHRRRLGRL